MVVLLNSERMSRSFSAVMRDSALRNDQIAHQLSQHLALAHCDIAHLCERPHRGPVSEECPRVVYTGWWGTESDLWRRFMMVRFLWCRWWWLRWWRCCLWWGRGWCWWGCGGLWSRWWGAGPWTCPTSNKSDAVVHEKGRSVCVIINLCFFFCKPLVWDTPFPW